MRWPWRHEPGLLRGIAVGVLLMVAGPVAINRTSAADRLVAPLLVADDIGPADAIVVLGAGVIGDCAANRYAVRRVLHGAQAWREGRAPFVLFTGGPAEGCAVAGAMARLARDLGVPAERIRTETASTSTHENAVMTAPLLAGWGVARVLLVTDRLHMRRAAATFRQAGIAVRPMSVPVFESHDDNVEMLRWGLREYAALAYYRLRGWIGAPVTATTRDTPPMAHALPTTGPLVILGASYAQGWPLAAVGDVPVVNRGVGGEVSADLLARFDRDIVPLAPRAVVLWGFINDITRAPADGMDQAVAGVRANYQALIVKARQHGIEPVLATEVTLGPMAGAVMEFVGGLVGRLRGRVSYQDRINAQVLATNRWLSDLAHQEGVLLLQLQSVMAEENGRRRRPFTEADGSHITSAGYGALTSYALPILEGFLRVR